MLTGAIIGVVVALTMMVVNQSMAKSGKGLPGQIERELRGKPPMNLKEIAALMKRDSLFGRGKVAQALAGLQSAGKVKVHQAPPGTPQLQRVDVIKYEVIS